MLDQGFTNDEIEVAVTQKLEEYDEEMVGIEFILDIENIAETVQPETDKMLKDL
jgi:hypothetical protein